MADKIIRDFVRAAYHANAGRQSPIQVTVGGEAKTVLLEPHSQYRQYLQAFNEPQERAWHEQFDGPSGRNILFLR